MQPVWCSSMPIETRYFSPVKLHCVKKSLACAKELLYVFFAQNYRLYISAFGLIFSPQNAPKNTK